MPFVTGILSAAVGFIIARVITRVLAGLGVGYVAYQGFEMLFNQIQDYLSDVLFAMPVQVLQILQILNVESAINLYLSALAARVTIIPIYRRFVSLPVPGEGGSPGGAS